MEVSEGAANVQYTTCSQSNFSPCMRAKVVMNNEKLAAIKLILVMQTLSGQSFVARDVALYLMNWSSLLEDQNQ